MVRSAEESSSNTMSESEAAENLLPKRETSKYMSDADLKRANQIFEKLPISNFDDDPETLHYNNLRHWAKPLLKTRFQQSSIELEISVPHHQLQSARTRLRTELLERLAEMGSRKPHFKWLCLYWKVWMDKDQEEEWLDYWNNPSQEKCSCGCLIEAREQLKLRRAKLQ